MEFAHACTGVGVRPIVGTELTVECGAETAHVTLLVESAASWANLCRLITRGMPSTRPKEGREPLPPSVPFEQLERHTRGLVCLSGCAGEGRWRDAGSG